MNNGESKKTNVTENVIEGTESVVMPDMDTQAVPEMSTPVMQEAVEAETSQLQVAESEKVDLNKSIFGTSAYQMVTGKRNSSLQRLEEYRITRPKDVQEIENFVAQFDYKNPVHIENFAKDVMGIASVKNLVDFMKNNKDGEAYDDIRVMLLEFIDDMKPATTKKTLLQRLKEFINKEKANAEIVKLEQAKIDEIIDVMHRRTESNLVQIATNNRAEIKKSLGIEQQRALLIDKFVIAGELIWKKIEEEYLPVLKEEYEKDPTSAEKKIALKEAEEKAIEFLARLNNVITTSAVSLINVDILLKQKETNKGVELFLQRVLDNTIPTLAQQCMINIMNRKNGIPVEEAMKIQEITEQILLKNAKEVGDLYIATVEQSGRPFISLETLQSIAAISKETNEKVDELKKQQLTMQRDCHEKLEEINTHLRISATEMAVKTMTHEELVEMQKVADSFKPTM